MARKDSEKQNQSDPSDELGGNVDQIRQILFGGQMRDYEKRFVEMEKRLLKSIEQLANNFEKRVDRLDAYSKREVGKLTDQLKAERKTRAEDGTELSNEIDNLGQQVESWFAEVEEQMESESRQLRASLKAQGDELLEEIQDTSKQVSSSLQGETQELAEAKLGREDLAALLSEVALRLKKDFKLPRG